MLCVCVHVYVNARETEREREREGRRERERERGRDLRLRQHMLSTQKTYTMPLVNKVVGMPLGANLDCDLRRCRGFVSERACVCVCVFSACECEFYS